VIEVISQVASVGVGIGMAMAGFGYWSLVGLTLMLPLSMTVCLWIAASWIPGRPRREPEIWSMLRFGGTVTLNSIVVYIAYSADKILLGRFWGANSLGIYERAYTLISVPSDGLGNAIGGVAFPALSRLQSDPPKMKSYFLKGYSLYLALSLPVTIACAAFSNDLIYVLLSPKWMASAPIFRLLAPTVMVFAMINPLSWLMFSTGRVARSLKIGLVLAPLLISAYALGLPHGPSGVAFAFSVMMVLLAAPVIIWAIHGTIFSLLDFIRAATPPVLSAIVAAGVSLGLKLLFGPHLSAFPRLILEGGALMMTYLWMLLIVMGKKSFYLGLLKEMRLRKSTDAQNLDAF
jgi:O-antigen/teichoic acid export membrane protein